jgi:hypothetical protein
MTKFTAEVLPTHPPVTARVGSAANAGGRLVDNDMWKFLKLGGDSRYALCAVGNPIEGQLVALDPSTQDGYSMGSVRTTGRIYAECEGTEAAGTGSIAVGDYVVAGTPVAAGTAISGTIPRPKVRKATEQPGSAIAGTFNAANVGISIRNSLWAWRVISIGDDGAVADTCVIERVNEI